MTNKLFRQITRWIHIIGSIVIIVYIYTSLGANPAFMTTVRFVTIPLLVLTGLAMWQQPRLMKLLRRNR